MLRAIMAVGVALALAVGAALASLPPASARIPDFQVCVLKVDVVAQLLTERVRIRFAWYDGRQAQRILAAFKAGTAQQEIAGDGILVATYPDIRDRIFLFQQGCYLAHAVRPPGWAKQNAGEP